MAAKVMKTIKNEFVQWNLLPSFHCHTFWMQNGHLGAFSIFLRIMGDQRCKGNGNHMNGFVQGIKPTLYCYHTLISQHKSSGAKLIF